MNFGSWTALLVPLCFDESMTAEVFMDHQDSWHKSCHRKCGKDKLDRAQRRRDLEEAGRSCDSKPVTLVAYGSGKRMVTGSRAGSRIKTRNLKRRFLPHHKSQRCDIWCTRGPVVSCFSPNFVDWSVPYERSSGVWNFGDVSVTYRRSFGNHTLTGALCSGNILPEPALVSQQYRCFTKHNLIISNI